MMHHAPTAHYASYYRFITQGVMHLATAHMTPGEALCGWPPVGCKLTDEAPDRFYEPGALTSAYDRICEACNERL